MRTREFLHEVMSLAWQFVKRNGYTMSEAMKVAWANLKLKGEMKKKIVKFYFKKVDGSVREAYGTLNEKLMPATLVLTTEKRMIPSRLTMILNAKNSDASKKLI